MTPNEAKANLMDVQVGEVGRNAIRHGLVKANIATIDKLMTLAALLTNECDFDGYGPLNPAFSATTIGVDDVAKAETGVVEWTAGVALAAPQTIYGVFGWRLSAVDGVTKKLVYWHRLVATVTLANPGEKFRRVITLRDTDYVP